MPFPPIDTQLRGPLYAYLRKSRADDPGEPLEVTLRKHRAALDALAQRLGLPVARAFEEVATGDSLYLRPRMLELLEAVEAGECEAVLCMDIDRLGRGGMRDQGVILDAFKFSGTKIITPERVYDLNDDGDEEMVEFKTFFSRREYKTITKRLQRGLRQSVSDGAYISNPPYGYRRAVVDKRPTLEIDEQEAAFVRMIFDLYTGQECGCGAIAEQLNALGAKPRRAARFSRGSVEKILKNPVYIGKVVWNRSKHIRKGQRGNEKHLRVPNPESDWVVADGLHEPIIPPEAWRRANEILKGRYHPPSNTGAIKNPLAGIVTCGFCGSRMAVTVTTNRQGRQYGYLRCPKKGCNAGVNVLYVEEQLLDRLEKRLMSLEIGAAPRQAAGRERSRQALAAARKAAARCEAQKNRLYDLLEQGVYTAEVFNARRDALSAQLEGLEARAAGLERQIRAYDSGGRAEQGQKIKDLLTAYAISDAQHKNQLFKDLFESVVYRKAAGAPPRDFDLSIRLK